MKRELLLLLVERFVRRPLRAFWRLPWGSRLLLAACLILSTVIVWGFKYPAGVDLPQHAHLFGVLANFHDPALGAGGFFDLQPITPYLLTYVVGALLAKLMGPLAATKSLLFAIALATPYTLWRWLRAIHGETSFAFWGFVLAFGYPYVWGFTSYAAAMPVAFLCMEAWVRAPDRGAPRRVLALSLTLLALFFTHAITFAVVATALGLSTLASFRVAFWRRSIALLVAALVSVGWFLGRGMRKNDPPEQFPGEDRFAILFGGEFHITEDFWAAAAGLAFLVVLFVVTRPALSPRVDRWLPFTLAGLGFFAVPNIVMDTAFVGHRFVFLLHAFAPAAFIVRPSRRARRFVPSVNGALTVIFLVVLAYRLVGLNREMRGLATIASKVPAGGDARGILHAVADDSEWFGIGHLSCSYAWLTTERLGMLENDHSRYYQLPIVRAADVPFLGRYRYLITRGRHGASMMRKNGFKNAPLFAEADGWAIYEDVTAPPYDTSVGTILRYGQDWGDLRLDQGVAKGELSIAGQRYRQGLGTHAHSLIQLRPSATGSLAGSCGVDDAGTTKGRVRCTVLDHRERVLAEVVVKRGRPPAKFEVPVRQGETIYLKATMAKWKGGPRETAGAHVDWVDLQIE